ncbi:transposase [Gordonia amicalis]|uniref:transposase n=1 Tax=Gordonia amicalis TaxID=89053 RepID=UPI0015F520D3|nr:transposase [Gordonia amicalis]MBA5846868.1 transposase [Gordonia amicalis]
MCNAIIDNDPSNQILAAHIAKEELRQCFPPRVTLATLPSSARRLYRFYTWCADADIPEITRLATTIETWWPAVLAFLHSGLTNARTEGYNRLVKQVKCVACGFRNTETHGAGYDSTAPAPIGPASSNCTADVDLGLEHYCEGPYRLGFKVATTTCL